MRVRLIVGAVVAGAVLALVPLRFADAAAGGGYDDWSCRPTAAHPNPVVLLHGLGGDPQGNWAYIGPALAADGYCVFASPYSAPQPGAFPAYGLASIDAAADDVAAFVEDVLDATGAAEVDLVGHSEGGFLSLYVPKFRIDGDRIGRVVAIAAPAHGTTFFGLVTLGNATGTMGQADRLMRQYGCPGCADLVAGGPAVNRLNDGPIAQPGIAYTVLATRFDALVRNEGMRPATETAFVREPGVRNAYVQDTCPLDPVGHVGLAFDPSVLGLVRQALDPDVGPQPCGFGAPS